MARGYPDGDLEARDEWFNKIQEKLHEMPTITASINNPDKSFHLFPYLYAQQQELKKKEPSWIFRLPEEKTNLYFVGIGDSSDIKKAKEYSFSNAMENAIDYLMSQFKSRGEIESMEVDFESLSEYLVKSGKVEDTYFRYDQINKSYKYFTLLRMSKRNAEIDMKLFAVQKKVHVPVELSLAVEKPLESTEEYFSRRMGAYSNFLDEARKSLSQQQYEIFMEARQLRKDGNYEKAVQPLEQIAEGSPDFYFGWYNLALTYDSLNDFSKANRAYEKAAELEPRQPARDASFFNTYGYFLYRHEKYEEAIVQLKKALEIDPDHPKAKRTLKAAEDAIR